MKKYLLPLLIILGSENLDAQEAITPAIKTFNRELGIFGQTEAEGEHQYTSMIGLQYKHWHTEHLGFRVIGAFAQFSESSRELIYARGDTSFMAQQRFDIKLPVIGFGIEAQRHFYKKLYLFAALELKGGYGTGDVDTLLGRTIGRQPSSPTNMEMYGRRDASLLYAGLTASIGAKLQFSRLCLGLEMLPVQMAYRNLDDGTRHSSGTGSFNIGNFSQRMFLHYRL